MHTLARAAIVVAACGLCPPGSWLARPSAADTPLVERLERTDEAMGSWFTIVAHGPDRTRLERAADAAFEEVHRLDRLLSNYKPTSEWSAVNRDAADRPVVVSLELFDLLSSCLEYSRASAGAFDITVGPLVRVWGFHRGDGALPPADLVARTLRQVGYRHVVLDPERRTVRFLKPGIELDPGGIGKGYAIDRMVAVLKQHGVASAPLSAAGSSIYGLGIPPGEPRGWRIPVARPGDPDAAAGEVYLEDFSISTSGSYEKFFWAEGRRYSHIIDPRTGYPARGVSSVSVVAARTLDSEAWTKPYFINGREWTIANRRPHHRVLFCNDEKNVGCSWIE